MAKTTWESLKKESLYTVVTLEKGNETIIAQGPLSNEITEQDIDHLADILFGLKGRTVKVPGAYHVYATGTNGDVTCLWWVHPHQRKIKLQKTIW